VIDFTLLSDHTLIPEYGMWDPGTNLLVKFSS
jgi:hypothetical protein